FVQAFIKKIKRFKCKFSLDDFGSGYSSYSYLKSLDVDYLKIDGIFVKDIVNNPADQAMVKSINEIGHFLGMKTVAEFVENEEIINILKEIGVDYAQGYVIEKPLIITEFMEKSKFAA
ncbi:MAG: EAL domain-containing protein, partial [Thiotrichaceae bacterium]|nr:EAL domain-containing protein [Thiotrichaceae bacterium]